MDEAPGPKSEERLGRIAIHQDGLTTNAQMTGAYSAAVSLAY